MQPSTRPGLSLPKYCSVAANRKAPDLDAAALPWDLSFTCPCARQAPCLPMNCTLTRCASCHPCSHTVDTPWQGLSWPRRVGDAAGPWVLARREPDGFYYVAQIKTAPELERQGALVVEFEAPLVTGLKLPAQQRRVVFPEDVIQFSPSVPHSLKTGDKVLAPWEPEQQQYGPGTVLLGLKKQKGQRASKEEEITVHFWNGKTIQVPVDKVRWVPPTVWKKAVERLQTSHTRNYHSAFIGVPHCSALGPQTGCVRHRPSLNSSFLCSPGLSCARCQFLYQSCFCGCPLVGPSWWSLTRTSEVTSRKLPEPELKPTAQLLPLQGPTEQAIAAFSYNMSSSSEEENSESHLEMGLPQRQMVSRAVNTDPTFSEKPLQQGQPCQPEWRYWRRNGPEPPPGKPEQKSR
ncbi:BC051019 [Phodopus roborovskii]|uniref:BC051019 protein n=1 Tax=Phodopus roborovskii TaxID=109678 RepID=A0AAU9ZLT4_PHORO|nr:BC051019 [Phodopus roborovskii]